MLIKLLKYEYRATAKLLLPLYLGVLFVIMLNAILLRISHGIPALAGSSLYSTITIILGIISLLGFWATLVISFISGVQRFYGLLGTRGYLMFSLPVTVDQLIASKLICSVSWFIAALLLGNVFFRMLAMSVPDDQVITSLTAESWPIVVFLCIDLLIMLCAAFLYFYFCIALGGQWPQNRLLATVVCYFVLSFVVQIAAVLSMVALVFVSVAIPSPAVTTASSTIMLSPYQSAILIMSCIALFFIGASVILWLLIRYFLTKKLNLA